VNLAGIAWAQTRGIDKVEIRIDETGPRQPTQLSTQVNPATWRMWRIDLPLPPGLHSVQTRATGWPSISFTVA
jgi:hypothetical protein